MSPPQKTPGLSVFFPAYNDSGTIGSLVISAVQAAATLTPDYEVLVINDGSRDETAHILDELARVYPAHVRIIHHAKNRGYGGALRSGFEHAAKDLVFYTDGDAQYDPSELELLWSRQPVDQVIAEIQSWMRKNPVSVRTTRPPPPRRRPSAHRSYHHQRHLKKTVF